MEEYWPDSNLDIYIPCDNNLNNVHTITKQMNSLFKHHYTILNSDEQNSISNDKVKLGIINIFLGDDDNVSIRTINVNTDNKQELLNNFDFDICKNLYYFESDKPILYINNFTNIINKQTKFNHTSILGNSFHRMVEYINRGFTFDKNNISYEQLALISKNIINKFDYIVFKLRQVNDNLYKLVYGDIGTLLQCTETCSKNKFLTYINNYVKLNKIKQHCDDKTCMVNMFPSSNHEMHIHIKGLILPCGEV